MSLESTIQADMRSAMKSGNTAETGTLRNLLSKLKDERIKLRPKREMTDEDALRVLMTAAKQRKESIELYRKGGRQDLVDQEEAELSIVQRYLPEQISEAEVSKIIDEIIAATGAASMKDMGKVMGQAMGRLQGKADGKLVQNLVRQRLA